MRWNGRSIRRLLGKEPYLPRDMVLSFQSVQRQSRKEERDRENRRERGARIGNNLKDSRHFTWQSNCNPSIGLHRVSGHFGKAEEQALGLVEILSRQKKKIN